MQWEQRETNYNVGSISRSPTLTGTYYCHSPNGVVSAPRRVLIRFLSAIVFSSFVQFGTGCLPVLCDARQSTFQFYEPCGTVYLPVLCAVRHSLPSSSMSRAAQSTFQFYEPCGTAYLPVLWAVRHSLPSSSMSRAAQSTFQFYEPCGTLSSSYNICRATQPMTSSPMGYVSCGSAYLLFLWTVRRKSWTQSSATATPKNTKCRACVRSLSRPVHCTSRRCRAIWAENIQEHF